MSVSDPIADYLTRIRNASNAYHQQVEIPASKLKRNISEILKAEGYIDDVTFVPDRLQGMIIIQLRYDEFGKTVIRGINRVSRPGRRMYVSSDKLPKVRGGLGTAIFSTSRGVLTDRQARLEKVGGEYLCSVW